jgi:hypothetical protein
MTSNGASESTTVGRVGARRKRRTDDSIWSFDKVMSAERRRSDARRESPAGLNIDTEYPGTFSAMICSLRS